MASTDFIWFLDTPSLAEELTKYVAGRLDNADAFEKKSAELCASAFAEEGQSAEAFAELIKEFLAASPAVFTEDAEDAGDIEGFFSVLATLLMEVQGQEIELANEFCSVVASDTSRPVLRLRILTNLYNQISPKMNARFSIFKKLLAYAGQVKKVALLDDFLSNIGALLKKWGVSKEEQRDLYDELAKLFGEAGMEDGEMKYLVAFLKGCEGADAATISSDRVKEAAAKVVVGAVKEINVRQDLSLIHLQAVQQLKGDDNYGQLYELLRIFVSEKLPAYSKFYETNKEYVTKLGVDHQRAVENMRLLSLCSLALENGEIPYQLAAETLQVEQEQVEGYVLEAISQGLIDAKMDQLEEVIVIHSAMHRSFGMEQWKLMQKRLHQWKEQVQSVLEVVKQRRQFSQGNVSSKAFAQ